jgi:hypothetical protein
MLKDALSSSLCINLMLSRGRIKYLQVGTDHDEQCSQTKSIEHFSRAMFVKSVCEQCLQTLDVQTKTYFQKHLVCCSCNFWP